MIADLLSWFEQQRRDLPWRRDAHAYSTWVSEIMLQQTRVEAVIPYFERWMARFPDVSALASAPEEEVLQHWAGLGYYRRARFLRRAAVQVVNEHDGHLPKSAAAWRELPGVGEYTSAAIASIALGEAIPVVDGNVKRVAARVLALDLAADDRKLHKSAAEWGAELMEDLATAAATGSSHHPGDLNEALMELGATVCTPRTPQCALCPIQKKCSASKRNHAEDYPRPAARTLWKAMDLCFGWTQSEQGCLLIQRKEGWNAGLWEPPSINISLGVQQELWQQSFPKFGQLGEKICRVKHTITHHKITARVFQLNHSKAVQLTPPDSVPLTGLARKILNKCWEPR